MTTFRIDRTKDSTSYSFSIVPDGGALPADITVRWEIVPIGELPIAVPPIGAVLSGTEDFTSGATAGITVNPTIGTAGAHSFPRDFEIRLYDNSNDDLLLTEAARFGGDSTLSEESDVRVVSLQDDNVVTIGSTDNFVETDGGGGDDTFIVTRFQYGDVVINDDSAINANLIKFDYDVTITGFIEDASLFGSFLSINYAELTLSTGAKVRIETPSSSAYSYQLGNGNILDYAGFTAAIGVTYDNNNPNIAPVANFPQDGEYRIASFTNLPDLTLRSRTEEETTLPSVGLSNSDVYSAGHDYDLDLDGSGGDDIFIVTRFQFGDVVINDDSATTINLIKFDYGVTITGFIEDASLFGSFLSINYAELTLSTGAKVRIEAPSSSTYRYQLGNEQVQDYDSFTAAIGVTYDDSNPNIAPIANFPDGGSYNIPFPSTTTLFDVSPSDLNVDVEEDASSTDNLIDLNATLVADNTAAVSYDIISGNDAGLFTINPTSGVISLVSDNSLDYDVATPPVYRLTVELSATPSGGTEAVTETVDVTFTVIGVNEHDPVLGDPAIVWEGTFDGGDNNDETARIEETAYTGTRVHIGTFMASDADRGPNGGVLTYGLTGGDGKFEIEQNGEIYLIAALDSSTATHSFSITVSDDGGTTTSTPHPVTVTVVRVDTNEKPVLGAASWAFGDAVTGDANARTLVEGTAADTTLASLDATDVDDDDTTLTYSFMTASPTNGAGDAIFEIDGTALKLAVALDLEDSSITDFGNGLFGYELVIVATDDGGAVSDPQTITIYVDGIDDNDPVRGDPAIVWESIFDGGDDDDDDDKTAATIGEYVYTGERVHIGTFIVTDADRGPNGGVLTYGLTGGGGKFEIEQDGKIYLVAALDSTIPDFTVTASDDGGATTPISYTVSVTLGSEHAVIEDADVKYVYPQKIGVLDYTPSALNEDNAQRKVVVTKGVEILTTKGDAVSEEAIKDGDETIGYRATGTYGVLEYYLFGNGWNYNVNHNDPDTIAKAGAPISEEFVFRVTETVETTPAGGTANSVSTTSEISVNVNARSDFSYVEAEGSLDISDPDITGVTILTTSGSTFILRGTDEDESHLIALTVWGTLEYEKATGDWVYTLNNADPDFQLMRGDQNFTETFVFQITKTGGTTEEEIVTIDAIGVDEHIYFVDKDGNEITTPGDDPTATITTAFSRHDPATIGGVIESVAPLTVDAVGITTYGVLEYDLASNYWEYTLNHDHASVMDLEVGDTLTETITLRVTPSGGVAYDKTITTINVGLAREGIYFADESGDPITLPGGKQYFSQDGFEEQFLTTFGGGVSVTLDLSDTDITSPGGLILGDVVPKIGGLLEESSVRVDFAKSVSKDLTDIFYISRDGTLGIQAVGTPTEVETLLAGHRNIVTLDNGFTLDLGITLDLVISAPRETDEELTYQVVVNVINGNSNVLANIPEDASVGYVVGKVTGFTESGFFDPDDSTATLTYTIEDGDDNDQFSIDENGVITLVKTLDAETTPSYTLTIKATYDPDGDDATKDDETHSFDVVVNVVDVNEHAPRFDAVKWLRGFADGNIPENAATGPIATISATDADASPNLTYTITNGDPGGIFDIDQNGRLILTRALDYETTTSYSLTIQVSDGDNTATTSVTINVTDIDPELAWESGFANGVVAENTATGTHIATVTPDDSTATLTYTITAGNTGNAFTIDEATGVITLTGALDYETTDRYEMTITASDGTDTTITIFVADIDPEFAWESGFANGVVAENTATGTHIATLAKDADNTATLTYAITAGNIGNAFAIDANGRLTIADADALDYETTTSYKLTITATDGTKTTPTDIAITITNFELEFLDNAVTWETAFANGVVSEDTDTTTPVTLGTIAVEAPGTNSLIYSITDGNADGIFALTGAGVLSLEKSLDAETAASHTLTIQVSDGTNVLDTTTITINVGDVNDNTPEAPIITWLEPDPNKKGEIPEATTIGTTLATVTAVDDVNDRLTYSISGTGSDLFDIENGRLILKGLLDYETTTSYNLMITASDGTNTSPPTSITISVTDSDPEFSVVWEGDFANGVAENTWGGTHLATVTAAITMEAGKDQATIRYYVNVDDSDNFTIDEDGILRLADNHNLDYETASEHLVTIFAQIFYDGDEHLISVNLPVNVLDVEGDVDFVEPAWEAAFADGIIAEDTAAGTTKLAEITAQREDGTSNDLTYSITAGNTGNVFAIDANGNLTLANALDFDTTESYSLTIQVVDANDNTKTDQIKVEINVRDVNRHTPTDPVVTWESDFASGSIAEDTAIGTHLATALSTDGDASEAVTYSISGTGSELFNIDEVKGTITLAGALDFETTTSYSLTITASDGTNTATTDMTINVTDIDPELVWESGFANGFVAESTAADTHIVTVTPDDSTATLTYAITAGNTGNAFTIDANTGAITLTGALDYATTADYTLSVRITNTAGNTIATPEVHIRVGGTEVTWEDGFSVDATTANIVSPDAGLMNLGRLTHNRFVDDSTTTTTSTTITTVTTSTTYSIAGADKSRFAISSHEGETDLYFLGNPGTLEFNVYTLTIVATETTIATNAIRTDSTDIVVIVGNNNAPAFASTPVVWEAGFADNVQEDTAIGTLLGQVDASDADRGATKLSYYFVDNGVAMSSAGAFRIDEDTGAITLASALDYETTTSYDLTIRVSDGYKNTDTDIRIAVSDVEFRIDWATGFAGGNVSEDTTIPSGGLQLVTITPDVPASNYGYRFASGSTIYENFRIDQNSGVITLLTALDYETATSHRLDVKVIDTTTSETITLFPVIINVVDVNEAPAFAPTPVTWGADFTNGMVDENTAIGAQLGQVDASDSEGAQLRYYFVDVDNNDQLKNTLGAFKIGRFDGVITLGDYLDYEAATRHDLTIRVTDGVHNINSTTQTITVGNSEREIDWGDGFANGDVREDTGTGAIIATITVDDTTANPTFQFLLDGGTTGQVDGAFTIDATTGAITLTGALDYEASASYTLQVQVVGTTTETISVAINVVDVDEDPAFAPTPVTWEADFTNGVVDENTAIGTQLGTAQATDPESGNLNYVFVDDTGAITLRIGAIGINFDGKISVVGDLDYATTNSYSLTIRARDDYTDDANYVDTTITISVVDNDASVVWESGFGAGEVSEDTATNTLLATITPDAAGTRTYEFVGGTSAQVDGAFTIDAATGAITLTGALDYDDATSHDLTVRVTNPATTTSEDISFTVNVVNEIEVTWESAYSGGTVSENTANGANLATITQGSDGGNSYAIIRGNPDNLFVIQNIYNAQGVLTGANLILQGALDYETKSSYDLEIALLDDDGISVRSEVTVNVGDGNDAPQFLSIALNQDIGTVYIERDSSLALEIDATTASGATLGTLIATDPNGDYVSYRIVSGRYFTIQNGNQIALAGDVPTTPTFYRLTIEASDAGGLTDTTDVVIRIGGNDNAPVFEPVLWQQDFDTNGVSEIIEGAGTIVAYVDATDVESGSNLRYQFMDEDGAFTGRLGAFDIVYDDVAGRAELRLNQPLDYETAPLLSDGTRGYTLKVVAIDSPIAGTGKFTETEIIVKVRDVDDYVQWYSDPDAGYDNGYVDENSATALNVAIGKVRQDIEVAGVTLEYRFLDGNTAVSSIAYGAGTSAGSFVINQNTGEISLQGSAPDFEQDSSHTLTVQVSSTAGPGLGTPPVRTFDVTINIADINEAPAFVGAPFSFNIAENAPIDHVIDSVGGNRITDVDGDTTFTYRIISGDNTLFAVNRNNGDISLLGALDYDAATSHTLTIRATDPEGLYVDADVTINVQEYVPSKPVLSITGTASVAEQATASTDAINVDGVAISVTGGNPFANDFIVTGNTRFDVVEVNGVWKLQLKAGKTLAYDGNPITLTLQVDDGAGRVSDPEQVVVTVLDRPTLTASNADTNLDVVGIDGTATPHALATTFSVTDTDTDLATANVDFDISVVSGTALEASDFEVRKVSDVWTLHYVGAPITEADFLQPFLELDVSVSTDGIASTNAARVRLNLNDGTYLAYQDYDNDNNPATDPIKGLFKIWNDDHANAQDSSNPGQLLPANQRQVDGTPATKADLIASNLLVLDSNYIGQELDLSFGRDIYFITNDIAVGTIITIRDVPTESPDAAVDIIRLDDNIEFKSIEVVGANLDPSFDVSIYTLTFDVENDGGTKLGEVTVRLENLDTADRGYQFQVGEFGEIQDFEDYAEIPIPIPDII